jgi:hypothetical protein
MLWHVKFIISSTTISNTCKVGISGVVAEAGFLGDKAVVVGVTINEALYGSLL